MHCKGSRKQKGDFTSLVVCDLSFVSVVQRTAPTLVRPKKDSRLKRVEKVVTDWTGFGGWEDAVWFFHSEGNDDRIMYGDGRKNEARWMGGRTEFSHLGVRRGGQVES
jgi:hypothetical protein